MCCALLGVATSIAPRAGAAPAQAGLDGFAARVEAEVRRRSEELRRRYVAHYALVAELPNPDLRRAMAPVSFRRDGAAYVLGVDREAEYHGAGILGLLRDAWRPGGRRASWQDRFPFLPNGESVALGALYEGHKKQLFVPSDGSDSESGLPRMLFFAADPATARIERDAYSMLRLLVARETDFAATWENHLGQTLSVDLLLRAAWAAYREPRPADAEHADHSWLHQVEILLAYAARGGAVDPQQVRDRFLSVELSRGPEADAELLGHYAESLGFLAAASSVRWPPESRARAAAWLAGLPARFGDLGSADARHLTHLLRGLRMLVDAGWIGLEASQVESRETGPSAYTSRAHGVEREEQGLARRRDDAAAARGGSAGQ